MPKSVKILSRETLLNDFVSVERAQLSHGLFGGGMSSPLRRLAVKTPDSVAALLTDEGSGDLIFVRQFRYPVFENETDEAWMLELVAGRREARESAEETMRREIAEECHVEVTEMEPIADFYATPGAVTERIMLFQAVGRTNPDLTDRPEHGEDIEVVRLSHRDAFQMLAAGKIRDAKTFAALAWLRSQDG